MPSLDHGLTRKNRYSSPPNHPSPLPLSEFFSPGRRNFFRAIRFPLMNNSRPAFSCLVTTLIPLIHFLCLNGLFNRPSFRYEATLLRARFDEHQNETDMQKAAQVLQAGEEEFWENQHPQPYICKWNRTNFFFPNNRMMTELCMGSGSLSADNEVGRHPLFVNNGVPLQLYCPSLKLPLPMELWGNFE